MTERPFDADPGPDIRPMPRDRASLYAQAQMETARYSNFSASRQQTREHLGARERPFTPPEQQIHEVAAAAVAKPPNRWYALHSVLFPSQAPVEPPPAGETGYAERPPAVAVFSAAGGVGKTCVVATLGRALAGLGERVLLVDMSAYGLLPFYFASREVKPGVVRTFSSPAQPGQTDAPVRVLTLGDGEQLLPSTRGVSRMLVDLGTPRRSLPDHLLQLRPTLLVPILPDMSSLACLPSLETLIDGAAKIFYLLNQFDASLPLHVDVRAMLQQQLGERLLPFVLHRSPAVSEALAEGMTVIDYAPGSAVAEDYRQLAAWLRSLAAPATVSYGGMRWTERSGV